MSKPPPPAPTASAIGPCPTVIKIVGRPGTGSLPSTIAAPDHPLKVFGNVKLLKYDCMAGWLVGWLFWVKRPFETVFQSISSRLPKRGRKRRERTEESKNVQTTPTRTYCERSMPLPYCIQIVGCPGTGSLPSTFAPPDHPLYGWKEE